MRKSKIAMVACMMIVAILSPLLAQNVTNEVHTEPGEMHALGGIGFGWRGIGVSGGIEYILQKFSIPNFPLSMGVMAIAGMDFGRGFDLSASAMATLHWGMKAYKDFPEFIRNFDWYIGLGLGVGIVSTFGFGVSTGGGFSYYVNDKLAIDLHSYYINYFVGGGSGFSETIGIRYALK